LPQSTRFEELVHVRQQRRALSRTALLTHQGRSLTLNQPGTGEQPMRSFAAMSMFGARATTFDDTPRVSGSVAASTAALPFGSRHATDTETPAAIHVFRDLSASTSIGLLDKAHCVGPHLQIMQLAPTTDADAMATDRSPLMASANSAAPRTALSSRTSPSQAVLHHLLVADRLRPIYQPVAVAVRWDPNGLVITTRFDRATAERLADLENAIARFVRGRGMGIRSLTINGRVAAI
jgi:hypothetical protein